MSKGAQLACGLVLVFCLALVLFFRGTVAQVAHLYPGDLPPQPYFVPSHAGLLYVGLPVVVLAAVVVLLAPGLLLVTAFGRRTQPLGEWLFKGFAVSFLLHVFFLSALRPAFRGEIDSGVPLIYFTAAVVLAWAGSAFRVLRGGGVKVWLSPPDTRRLLWLAAWPVALVVLMLPVLFWQDLNPDGFEALTMGASLFAYPVGVGAYGVMPGPDEGILTTGFPVQWFIALFGPVEASARLPLLIYIPLLFAGVMALAELNSSRRLAVGEEAAVAAGLGAALVTLAYNASYHPYAADVASPANIDFLVLVFMLGALYFFWTDQRAWFLGFAALAFLTRPTGLFFLLLLGVGLVFSCWGKLRAKLPWLGLAIVMCLLLRLAWDSLLPSLAGVPLETAGTASITSRLRYLRLDDFSRWLYLVVPAGILPGLSLLAFRWQDSLGRLLTLVSVGYFLFFYCLAFVALHHFAPAMILPLVVFWRLLLRYRVRWQLVAATAVLAVLALGISLPRRLEVNRSLRDLGRAIVYRVGYLRGNATQQDQVVEQRDLLYELFASQWTVADPSQEFVISSALLLFYSRQTMAATAGVNYVVQPATDSPPDGFALVGGNETGVAYVKNRERWRRDRYEAPPTDYRSVLYDIPRATMLRHWGEPAENYTLDLKELGRRVFGSLSGE